MKIVLLHYSFYLANIFVLVLVFLAVLTFNSSHKHILQIALFVQTVQTC